VSLYGIIILRQFLSPARAFKVVVTQDLVSVYFLVLDSKFNYMGAAKIKFQNLPLLYIGDKDHFIKPRLDDYLLTLFGPRPFKKNHQINPKKRFIDETLFPGSRSIYPSTQIL